MLQPGGPSPIPLHMRGKPGWEPVCRDPKSGTVPNLSNPQGSELSPSSHSGPPVLWPLRITHPLLPCKGLPLSRPGPLSTGAWTLLAAAARPGAWAQAATPGTHVLMGTSPPNLADGSPASVILSGRNPCSPHLRPASSRLTPSPICSVLPDLPRILHPPRSWGSSHKLSLPLIAPNPLLSPS